MRASTLLSVALIMLTWGCGSSNELPRTQVQVTDTKSSSQEDASTIAGQSDTVSVPNDTMVSNDLGLEGEDVTPEDSLAPPVDVDEPDSTSPDDTMATDSKAPEPQDVDSPTPTDIAQPVGDDTITADAADTEKPSEEDTDLQPVADAGPPETNDTQQPEPNDTVTMPPNCPAPVTITAPPANEFFPINTPITFAAMLSEFGTDGTQMVVQWEDSKGNTLAQSEIKGNGNTEFTTDKLTAGAQEIYARLMVDGKPCKSATALPVNLCVKQISENFDAPLDSNLWKIHGAAYWDNKGWLEMTGTQKAKQGAIYNAKTYIEPGNVSIRFSIATGGGSSPGADGFAMTTVEADSVDELTTLVKTADSGGGLGYGVAGDYGNWKGNAFTVEIDTWYNKKNPGMTEKHTDPTKEDHIGITLDGDPGNHIVWTEVPDVEDLKWHQIRVDVVGTKLTVMYDGEAKVQSDVAELEYRGGYIFFSGSTGFYTNFHRFDNLNILHQCQ